MNGLNIYTTNKTIGRHQDFTQAKLRNSAPQSTRVKPPCLESTLTLQKRPSQLAEHHPSLTPASIYHQTIFAGPLYAQRCQQSAPLT